MVYKEHYIEIYVNGNLLELESQNSLNLRFQNSIYDPEKISSTQAEYSFEFEIPSTPNNDKIFDYANNLSKLNKFRSRFDAEVYGDGTLIFQGTLTLNGFKDRKYHCNLVSIKVYSLEEIFGDAVLTDVPWSIPFEGAGTTANTINYYNSVNEKVKFPLISYGAFQKSPLYSDEAGNDYTSKYDIDKYNRWYVESFAPSLNLLEYIKKAFNWKGYVVGGDAFTNPYLNNIYMSTNLADGQSPDYNIGNPKFGMVNLSATLTTKANDSGYQQELNFPYFRVGGKSESENVYNYNAVNIFNILSGNVTMNQASCYMYQPDENLIVVPADGFYKIELSASTTLNTTSAITVGQYTSGYLDDAPTEVDLELTPGLLEITPIEIALVKNYDDNYELIKGKKNRSYINGNPNDELAEIAQHRYATNAQDWETCFPHEDLYNSFNPTEKNDLTFRNTRAYSDSFGGRRSGPTDRTGGRRSGPTDRTGGTRGTSSFGGDRMSPFSSSRYHSSQGYIYNDGEIMCYDQAVSEAFVCGLSSLNGGVMAVMKNGYSWSKSNSEKNEAFYPEIGYSFVNSNARSGTVVEQTDHNENTYINTPISRVNATNNNMTGYISCIVYLHKNDVLNLIAVQRAYHSATYGDEISYSTTSNVNLKITAFSPRSYDSLKASHDNRYEAPVEFPVNLKVTGFMNKERKISDWMQQAINAFNFEFLQNGNTIEINSRKKFEPLGVGVVELDDRVNTAEAESSIINYPKSMAVRYKIDTDEHGFYITVPADHINNEDWKKWGDSGFTTVYLNNDSYVTDESNKDVQFSYTWYDNFNWYPVDSSFKQEPDVDPIVLKIPVISKEEYMIDSYDYTESMKHDGYGLTQRFWYAPTSTGCYVYTRTYPAELVNIYVPSNVYNDLNLSYKGTENSLLNNYFNLTPYLSSNYVTVEAYINADEYKMIKNGAAIHFDSDIYIPVEMSGFDPSGENKTQIKMIKKV